MGKEVLFIITLSLLTLTIIPSSNAVEFLGFDFAEFIGFVTSFGGILKSEVKQDNQTLDAENMKNKAERKEPNSKNTIKGNSNSPSIKPQKNITLSGVVYTESMLKQRFKGREEYVSGFNYECVSIITSQGEEFTLHFNTLTGEMSKLTLDLNCDRQIEIDETLINDLQKNGFQISNVKNYLTKIDLEMTMYFKVFGGIQTEFDPLARG